MTEMNEKLLDDERFHIVSNLDIRDGHYRLVAESHQWHAESLTEKAALITLPDELYRESIWIPKSVIGFSPSGELYLKEWFWAKNF